jgi:hypothetical protein
MPGHGAANAPKQERVAPLISCPPEREGCRGAATVTERTVRRWPAKDPSFVGHVKKSCQCKKGRGADGDDT